jgi:hypothetical protein
MSGDWVNRIGILLNFCAGFLLAPELIGIQRLERFEKSLEERLRRYRAFLESLPQPVVDLLALGIVASFFLITVAQALPFVPSVVTILGIVSFLLFRYGPGLLSLVLNIIIARLTGNARLRGIVVTLGIALFIVGNTLQLLATWL